MSLETDAERGRQALSLLNNEIYKEAVSQVRQGIIESWADSPIRDKEGQHELKLMLKLLIDLERNIATVAETGKLAQIEIEQQLSMWQRAQKLAGVR